MTIKKNILVTGGAGYIGSHTVVSLINNGFTPIILDDFRNSDRSVIQNIEEITGTSISVHEIDICNYEILVSSLKDIKINGIIHFAAYKAVGESVQEPLKYYHNNVLGLTNILSWAEANGVEQFIFSSSCTVYGEPENLKMVDEHNDSRNSNSPYGFTKVIGEQILRDLSVSGSKIKLLGLRYFNPIGAHESGLIGELPVGKPNNLLPFITQTAIGLQKELTVFGNDYPTVDGTCVRDYIHVMDLADAHVKGLEFLIKRTSEESNVDFINIGTGNGVSVLQMIELFEQETGVKLNWTYGAKRAGDVVEIFANANKAKELLNWQSKYSIQQAIKDAWNWELKRKNEK